MNEMRARAKEHFPTVLLTLLSIVQALALELLWSHLRESDYLFALSWAAALSWTQIAATFLALVLIWVVYASSVMRFRWVPVTSDSVYPFLIGLIEFMLIEALAPDEVGLWLLFMALTFGVMVWVSHTIMRRARLDGDNDAFFNNFEPASLRDFYPSMAVVCIMAATGAYLLISGNRGVPAVLGLLGTMVVLGWQFYSAAQFWTSSLAEDPDIPA